jgi:hypothetical protein
MNSTKVIIDKTGPTYEVWMDCGKVFEDKFNLKSYKTFFTFEEAEEYSDSLCCKEFIEKGVEIRCQVPRSLNIEDCLLLLELARDALTIDKAALIDEIDEFILDFREESE